MSEQLTPQPSTGSQQMMERIRPYLLDPREDYPEPYYMLEYNGTPFSAVGGLQAISGQKKNGKSFVLTQLMAAVLGKECERTEKFLPGLTVPDRTIEYLRELHGDPNYLPHVLYVDTEMEKLNSAKVLRRVHWLCGWQMREPNDRFNVLWLKSVKKESDTDKEYQLRYQLIRQAIQVLKPDVVFIDGLRDLLGSINEEEPVVEMLSNLATLAEDNRMCIWSALHQNPSASDSGDLKMRGWAGTELGNKVSDTLISIKSKSVNGVTFTVKQIDARGKDIDDWKFVITDDAGNLGVPRITNSGTNLNSKSKEQAVSDDPALLKEWINQADNTYNDWPMTRADIKKKVFGDIGGIKNKDRQQADLIAAINLRYLEETTVRANGYPMLLPSHEDECPF